MIIYLAGPHAVLKTKRHLFDDVHVLESILYLNNTIKEKIVNKCFRSFMLDSGAFTYMQGTSLPDWNTFVDRYVGVINELDIDLFFEMDIDSLVGYPKVKQIRKRIEQGTGKQCIPVWHFSRGEDELINLCNEYDYIALGGIAMMRLNDKKLKIIKKVIRTAHEHGSKIHGLGFTRLDCFSTNLWRIQSLVTEFQPLLTNSGRV